jgi:hypothetical protein
MTSFGAGGEDDAKEQTRRVFMFKTFAAALIATSMAAGMAFAAAPSDNSVLPSAATAGDGKAVKAPSAHKPLKQLQHTRKHDRRHFARAHHHSIRSLHQVYRGKTAKGHVARATSGAKTAKAIKPAKTAGTQSTKLPATRTN